MLDPIIWKTINPNPSITTELALSNASQEWPWLYQLDNRSYFTIKPSIFTIYNMEIEVQPALLELLDF